MRDKSAAPGELGGNRVGRIDGNSRIVPFASRERHGIGGLFFCMPRPWQCSRIRELARQFSSETISTIVRMPHSEVVSIIDGSTMQFAHRVSR